MDKRTLALIAGLFLLSSLSGSFLVAKICVRSGSGADSSHSLAIVAIKDQMDRELPALAASVQALRSDVAQVKTNTVVLGYVLGAVGDALFGDASVRDICAKGRSLHRTPPDETNHLLRVLETYSRGRVSDADIFWNAFLAGVSVVEQPSSRAVNVNSAPVSVADETTRQIRDIYAAIWGSGVHSYSSLYSVEPMKKQLDEISNALRRR